MSGLSVTYVPGSYHFASVQDITGVAAEGVETGPRLRGSDAAWGKVGRSVLRRLVAQPEISPYNAVEANWWKGSHMEAYCVKCREKREIQGAEKVTFKNGRKAMRGTCGHCGTSVHRFVGN